MSINRDAELHIKKSNFLHVLSVMSGESVDDLKPFADKFFELADRYSVKGRYEKLFAQKAATRKKVGRKDTATSLVSKQFIAQFHRYLILKAGKKQKVLITKSIREDSKDYLLLVEVAALCKAFIEQFEIDTDIDGIEYYIDMGLQMMGKRYALNKFKTYDSSIYERFNCILEIHEDLSKDSTDAVYKAWREIMVEYGASLPSMLDIDPMLQPDKYVHFVRAKEEADGIKADYSDYINAQFEGLSFTSNVPNLVQLYGENAIVRYNLYMSQSVEEPTTTNIVDRYKNLQK